MDSEKFIKNLLTVMPHWNNKLVKPFKQSIKDKMSLETYYCLQILSHNENMTMTELSQSLKISKQQTTILVENLYKYQFIERAYDTKDRRVIKIKVTQRALNYIEEYYHRNIDFIKILKNKISMEDIEQLDRALETLLKILPKLD